MPHADKRSRDTGGESGAGSSGPLKQARPLTPSPGPEIRALTGEECEAMLDRHQVGRLAYAFGPRVDIIPIHYVRDGAWLYGRTSPGGKIDAWIRSRWIAFEIDEVRGVFDWRSVVVHGGLYIIDADGSEEAAETLEHAIEVLRRLIPETGTERDPVPERGIIFRIHLDEVEGCTATTQ